MVGDAMEWTLSEDIKTCAGNVRAGQAGRGPPLVLAHGWPWSSYAWHRVIPTLAATHRVYWYDMPGYGASEKSAQYRTSLDVQGEVFAALLHHWSLAQPTVIAHDFGGATTLRAHLLHGAEYERLILMNVVAMRPWGSAFFDHVGRHVDAFEGLPPHIHAAIVRAYIEGAFATPIDADDLHALIAPWLTPDGTASFYRQFEQADEIYTAEVEPLYSALRCPAQILWGQDDPWIPLARGKALHAAIGGRTTFTELSGVGHMPQIEDAAAVLAALRPLLHP